MVVSDTGNLLDVRGVNRREAECEAYRTRALPALNSELTLQ